VTGYATTPGSYTLNSLSTMIDAVLYSGGPAAGGSYRIIELRRNGRLVSTLDLYELLLKGDKSHDATLQNQDVLNIRPVGPELAVTGSVNEPAIFEAKPGESLADIVRYAGGFDTLADTSRIVLRSLSELDAGGSRELPASALSTSPASGGDIVRVLSLGRVARPQEREYVLATIEGEVDHPGRYFLPPGARLSELLARAGGMTAGAFPYGTVVERSAIKIQEQASFDQAIANLQLAAAALPLQASTLSGGASAATARSQGALQIIDRLKFQRPDGRLILDVAPGATTLPVQIALENNDRIFIPPQPKTVGVFGAVYKTGSFLYTPGEKIEDYLRLAGGPQRIADRGDIFVVRANGSVVSTHEDHKIGRQPAFPGDVVFVPVRSSASLFEKILAATTVIYQFGVTALTLTALGL
jgi:protein involved in polysaccharide export with SLBB domain